jgi:hypothetical protein
MRLSETRQPRASRTQWSHQAVQEQTGQQKTFTWRTGLSVALLALLVAGVVGAIGLGRHLVTHAAGTPNPNCTLIVPNQPLTAQGLATPYQLVATNPNQGPCNESNAMQAAFVQGAVLDPATGQISVYNPLVIDKGTQPAAAPVAPQLPANAIVALWFGFNGDNLRLKGQNALTLQQANCVNGLGRSLFGQFAYCNAPRFFKVANGMIQAGLLTPPALGTAKDGQTCPTLRDFSVVDQDQSDNVTTTYLVTQDGRIAQNTPANRAALPGAQAQKNASDNGLLVGPLDQALGCTPWMAPDLAAPGQNQMLTALPLDELQAAMFQQAPVALVPLGDPMTLVNGNENLAKTNLYRIGVDQAPARSNQQASTKTYCQNLLQIGPARLKLDMGLTSAVPSPDPAAANNLFTFLAQRFNATFGAELNCTGLLNQPNPVTLQQDGNGVTIGATITVPGANGGNNGGNGGNNDGNGNNNGGQNNGDNAGNGGNGNTGGQNTGGQNTGGQNTGGQNTGGQANGGQANAPTCVINGVPVQSCSGTTTISQTCNVTYDANTNQVLIDCPGK